MFVAVGSFANGPGYGDLHQALAGYGQPSPQGPGPVAVGGQQEEPAR